MSEWLQIAGQVEALSDAPLDPRLVAELQGLAPPPGERPAIHFYTPTFKGFESAEISGSGRHAWPAVSITGAECKLQCDHCKAKVLAPMIPARTPEELWRVVNDAVERGARGMLLTGGSNHRDEVEYGPFCPTIRRVKDAFPDYRIAVHTALVDAAGAARLEEAGIDVAMMDVIGAQETVTQVYHLKRPVADFERTLEHLVATRMKIVPHIVIGLHYGRLLGEWNALEMIARHLPQAVVLVVAMPLYAPPKRPFATPDPHEVGRFFRHARARLARTPLLLGCARPAGAVKGLIDTYAVMAGLDGMAHPSDGIVELAVRLDRRVRVTPACCSIVVGEEVMALSGEQAGLEIDVEGIRRDERRRRAAGVRRIAIPVVAAPPGSGGA